MVGNFLKLTAGFFDKRFLISAMVPNLIFWGCLLFLYKGSAWFSEIAADNTLAFAAFFLWLLVWTILTANFQEWFSRLAQGYWPSFLEFFAKKRKAYWQREWQSLDDRDQRLEQNILNMEQVHQAFEGLIEQVQAEIASAAKQRATPGRSGEKPVKALGPAADCVKRMAQQIERLRAAEPLRAQNARQKYEQILALFRELAPLNIRLSKLEQGERQQAAEVLRDATRLKQQWHKRLKDLLLPCREERERVQSMLLQYFPHPRAAAMPTRFGNVLKSAEDYAGYRYKMDTVVFWPRLTAVLPSEVLAKLHDAKMGMYLFLNMLVACIVLVLPAALTVAHGQDGGLPPWVLIAAIVPVILQRPLYYALFGGFFVFWFLHFTLEPNPGWTATGQWFFVFLTVGFILGQLFYKTAVQAAVSYGESIKTAIDLHRWKILEAMHIAPPADLAEERAIWYRLGMFLYRGQILKPQKAAWTHSDEDPKAWIEKPLQTVVVITAKSAITPGMTLEPGLFEKQTMRTDRLSGGPFANLQDLEGMVSLLPLAKGEPLPKAWLACRKSWQDWRLVNLSFAPSSATQDFLVPGARIDLVFSQVVLGEQVVFHGVKIARRQISDEESGASLHLLLILPASRVLEFHDCLEQGKPMVVLGV